MYSPQLDALKKLGLCLYNRGSFRKVVVTAFDESHVIATSSLTLKRGQFKPERFEFQTPLGTLNELELGSKIVDTKDGLSYVVVTVNADKVIAHRNMTITNPEEWQPLP